MIRASQRNVDRDPVDRLTSECRHHVARPRGRGSAAARRVVRIRHGRRRRRRRCPRRCRRRRPSAPARCCRRRWRCPRRCCRRRRRVPHTMLSQSAPPQSVPQTMLSPSPPTVPQTMLSPSPRCPRRCCRRRRRCPRRCCRRRRRAPDDVVAVAHCVPQTMLSPSYPGSSPIPRRRCCPRRWRSAMMTPPVRRWLPQMIWRLHIGCTGIAVAGACVRVELRQAHRAERVQEAGALRAACCSPDTAARCTAGSP